MPPTIRFVSSLFAVSLLAAACGGDAEAGTIQLSDGSLAPDVEDIQTEPDADSIRDLGFTSLDGGADDTFASHLDKPLVVNFFAAWCGPCRAEMPEFEEVFQEVKDDVNFIGISRDDTAGPSLELIAETGVSYPTGWDQDGSIFPTLGLFAMPSTLFVDQDGVVIDQWSGILSGEGLREMIEEHLL
jgi:thiol-disulfide isomerase/thioredoxin